MPIPRYRLDDRSFDDLVKEMVARIPSHTPEWTNPQIGDPGRTLIDLFAWLGDTILYRVNLLPERQRLEFLRLLNIPMRPARAATGLVSLAVTGKNAVKPTYVPQYTKIRGPVDFETVEEITVLPVSGAVYVKRKPTVTEGSLVASIKQELEKVYNIRPDQGEQYITTPLYLDAHADDSGFDIARDTIDQSLWIALLAPDADAAVVELARKSFDPDENGSKVLNIGIEPRLKILEFDDYVQSTVALADLWQWEMPSTRTDSDTLAYTIPYIPLDVRQDTTDGFVKRGVVQLVMPPSVQIALPGNNVDDNIYAGTGNHPPRIDDESVARKLVSWIRLRPRTKSATFPVDWVGVNAVPIDQFKTLRNVVAATATGAADLTVALPGGSVDESTFALKVEEKGSGYRSWTALPLHMASRIDTVYELDGEAGTLKFGDGLRGVVPEEGARILIDCMRYGGGKKGNVEPGNLKSIAVPNLTVIQALPTEGGMDAETLSEAEKRIPGVLTHSNRAVTEDDYRQIASETPGIALGRVEILPKFKPQQKLFDIIGVMSVLVLPSTATRRPPNPRPDRHILNRVHRYVDDRRPIGVELYVIGAEYVPVGVGVSVTLKDGVQKHQVLQSVKDALYDFLWPLPPGGHTSSGWPLGRPVDNQELAVIVARVDGVLTVEGVNLFEKNTANQKWQRVGISDEHRMSLKEWQLPELLAVAVLEDENPVTDLDDALGTGTSGSGPDGSDGTQSGGKIAIPVVPEICK